MAGLVTVVRAAPVDLAAGLDADRCAGPHRRGHDHHRGSASALAGRDQAAEGPAETAAAQERLESQRGVLDPAAGQGRVTAGMVRAHPGQRLCHDRHVRCGAGAGRSALAGRSRVWAWGSGGQLSFELLPATLRLVSDSRSSNSAQARNRASSGSKGAKETGALSAESERPRWWLVNRETPGQEVPDRQPSARVVQRQRSSASRWHEEKDHRSGRTGNCWDPRLSTFCGVCGGGFAGHFVPPRPRGDSKLWLLRWLSDSSQYPDEPCSPLTIAMPELAPMRLHLAAMVAAVVGERTHAARGLDAEESGHGAAPSARRRRRGARRR